MADGRDAGADRPSHCDQLAGGRGLVWVPRVGELFEMVGLRAQHRTGTRTSSGVVSGSASGPLASSPQDRTSWSPTSPSPAWTCLPSTRRTRFLRVRRGLTSPGRTEVALPNSGADPPTPSKQVPHYRTVLLLMRSLVTPPVKLADLHGHAPIGPPTNDLVSTVHTVLSLSIPMLISTF